MSKTLPEQIMKTGMYIKMILCCILILSIKPILFAQNNNHEPDEQYLPVELRPPHPAEKTEQRFIIDAKRKSEDVFGDDALPRSREFIRIDSSYYVGWMFEGVYKYNHAADFLGFKNACAPLEKALNLLEHDYANALGLRTDNLLQYYPTHTLKVDYTLIANYLMNCYSNTEQPDKVYSLLRRTLKWKMQHFYYMDAYNYLAWTVHRNRFYTSAKYSFLKNSITANEKLANRYLDSALLQIERNRVLNKTIIPGMEVAERNSVYHYKNILYSYSLNIDSAMYYFNLMRNINRLPHNNYANFRVVCGDFRTAENEYKIASMYDPADKRLQEWAYYSSILDIYKARPKTGAELAKSMISANGCTPGFGWYNIALARCYSYDGQISSAIEYLQKAAEFKETHIGTTLGQSHYDFSIQLLKLINTEQTWQMQRFEHANWYFNPEVLMHMSKILGEKYLQQFLIINQFAENPERDLVIYKLFSTESTVAWDEIWYLVRDFSTKYFIRKFSYEAENDKRKYIHKYFNLFVAMLKERQGKYKEAKELLASVIADPNNDADYEKLFMARAYQAEAECAKGLGNDAEYYTWLYRLYKLYPQLVPFTGMPMNMNLHISGDVDEKTIATLKACNINWVANSSIPAAQAYITFTKNGDKKDISYYVLDNEGNYVVKKQAFAWHKSEATGRDLAYRLFDIGGKLPESEGD